MNANTEYLVKAIEVELDRLGVLDTSVEGGIGVYAEDDLPDGWVLVADSQERVYGLACDFLESLKNTNPEDGQDEDGDPSGWVAAWRAISDMGHPQFHGNAPDVGVWRDYHEFVKGVATGSGLGLVVLRTNAGLRWGFAPTDADYSAFNATHDFSEWHASAEDAMDSARDYSRAEAP